MLDQVLEVFRIVPDIDLKLMKKNQTLAGLTARATIALDRYMVKEKPDIVLVQGDTTTVFVASLVAFYNRIFVGHIEAGLRTGNLYSPWPEEGNRVLTSHIAQIHFSPTKENRDNLIKEGISPDRIIITGNTVVDALIAIRQDIAKHDNILIPGLNPDLLKDKKRPRVVLITGHRRENFGDGFECICLALHDLAQNFRDVHFIYPVHLNPNVQRPVLRILGNSRKHSLDNIHLIAPLPYREFVYLMHRSEFILTDSGGIQEEAPSFGKPVLVMRENSERPEAISAGTAKIVGTSRHRIVKEATRLLSDEVAYRSMARRKNPYGDGKAAKRIVKEILSRYYN